LISRVPPQSILQAAEAFTGLDSRRFFTTFTVKAFSIYKIAKRFYEQSDSF